MASETNEAGFFSFIGDFGSGLVDLVKEGGKIANDLAASVGQGKAAYDSINEAIHGSPSPDSIPASPGPASTGTPTAAPPAAGFTVTATQAIGLGLGALILILLFKARK